MHLAPQRGNASPAKAAKLLLCLTDSTSSKNCMGEFGVWKRSDLPSPLCPFCQMTRCCSEFQQVRFLSVSLLMSSFIFVVQTPKYKARSENWENLTYNARIFKDCVCKLGRSKSNPLGILLCTFERQTMRVADEVHGLSTGCWYGRRHNWCYIAIQSLNSSWGKLKRHTRKDIHKSQTQQLMTEMSPFLTSAENH